MCGGIYKGIEGLEGDAYTVAGGAIVADIFDVYVMYADGSIPENVSPIGRWIWTEDSYWEFELAESRQRRVTVDNLRVIMSCVPASAYRDTRLVNAGTTKTESPDA